MKRFYFLFMLYVVFSFAIFNESNAQTDSIIIIRDSIDDNTTLIKLMTNDSVLIHQYYAYKDHPGTLFNQRFAGFSNVSIIDCAPEKMALKTGWTWLSFPRLERKLNETVNAIGVLQNTTPFPGYLNFLGKNGNQQVSLTYSGYTWTSNGLSTIRSTSGYKLYTTNTDPTYVPVSGSVLDPSTSINIYAGYENWIGYFLNKSLTPAEAFGSQMDNLYEIKTQNWTMTKVNNQWISMTGNSPLKYGDMVAVKCYNDASFQWDNSSRELRRIFISRG